MLLFLMTSAQIIYCAPYLCFQISCNIMSSLIHIPCPHYRNYWAKIFRHYDVSISSSLNHFTYFFKRLGLPLVIKLVTPTFLGCWPLIILTVVICFQQNDHPIFLNEMAHIKIAIFPFQVALWDIWVSLSQVVHSQVPPFENLVAQLYTHLPSFFYKPPTQTRVCHTFNKCSFTCHANMSLILCRSNHKHLVINPSYHTYILFVFSLFT